MKKQTFEDYLQDIFFEENPQTLDDMFPDAFNEWLVDSDVQDILDHAEKWGKLITK